jgi:hypothetical protein
MAAHRLRVFFGPDEDASTMETPREPTSDRVTVPLGEILPLLADALRNGRTWLGDFRDDELTLSSDLYQTLRAYQHYRRPSA